MTKSKDCFCALCRSPRKLRYSKYLSRLNYLQIFVLTLVITAGLFSFVGAKGALSLPIVWILFESIHKSLYRRDLVCPYCGFDPKWYKKDVRFARQKVEDFIKQNPDSPILRKVSSVEISQSDRH